MYEGLKIFLVFKRSISSTPHVAQSSAATPNILSGTARRIA
jgi:hypothetical protein